MKKLLSSGLLIGYIFVHYSFSQEYTIDHITTRNGLSQNCINAICQDSDGYMWFATNDGLNRYDGYDFKVFKPDFANSVDIPSILVSTICEDNNASLWIGTSDNGVTLYNTKDETFSAVHKDLFKDENSIINNMYYFQNKIWISSFYKIFYVDLKSDSLTVHSVPFKERYNIYIRSFFKHRNQLFAATYYGAYKVHEKNGTFWMEPSNKIAKSITTAKSFQSGIIISYDDGVYFLDSTNTEHQIIKNHATSLLIESTNNIWIGTNNGLYLCQYTPEGKQQFYCKEYYLKEVETHYSSNIFITDIFKDKAGVIWVGTNSLGVFKIVPEKKVFRHYSHNAYSGSIKNDIVNSIYLDSYNNLWFALSDKQINYIPGKDYGNYRNGFIDINVPHSLFYYKISFIDEFQYKGNKILLTGLAFSSKYHAFLIRNNKPPVPTVLPKKLYSIVRQVTGIADDESLLWLGTYSMGVYRYNKAKNELDNFNGKNSDLCSDFVRSLTKDSKGNIWIGTSHGLNRIDAINKGDKNAKLTSLLSEELNSKNGNYILPIFESSTQSIWIGTLGGGLKKYINDSAGFKHYTTADGLSNNVVKAILEDANGNLWISTNQGLSVFDTLTREIKNYNISDGIQDNEFSEFSACAMPDGELLFGGVNGFNAFYPNQLVEDTSTPKIIFSELQVLNESIKPGHLKKGRRILKQSINNTSLIKLKHNENSFRIFFAGIHYSASDKLKYRYILKDFDENWTYTSAQHRIAKYTHVKAGNYVLRIEVSNTEGEWENNIKNLEIVIQPPVWKTRIAYMIYFVLIILTVVFFRKYTITKYGIKQQLEQERFEKEKMKELNALKIRFFTNISHEFRTPLTLILNYIEKLSVNQESITKEEMRKDLVNTKRNTNILLRLVNQLMDFRKIGQGKMQLTISENDIIKMVKIVSESFQVMAEQKNINYQINTLEYPVLLWYDISVMEKILINTLGNAFKFTPKNGRIDVIISEKEQDISIHIKDNGTGIKKDLQHKIFERFYRVDRANNPNYEGTGIGLSVSKEFVEMHKGGINLISDEGVGSEFIITFMKGKSHLMNEKYISFADNQSMKLMYSDISTGYSEFERDEPNEDETKDNIKILIVEDNYELRTVIKNGLHKFSVLEAANGEEGINKCLNDMPDIIVSDVMMPVMDGYKMCQSIKNNIQICHIPLILLTAKNTDESMIFGFDNGAEAFIPKPFNINVLIAQIDSILSAQEKIKRVLTNTNNKSDIKKVLSSLDTKFIERLNNAIQENLHNPDFTVEQLSEICGFRPKALTKKIKQLMGITPRLHLRNERIKHAKALLITNNYTVTEVMYDVGYSDIKYFRKCFKEIFGITPSEIRKTNK